MTHMFIVFRTYDRIWTCRTYTKQLSPFEFDATNGNVKLMFTIDPIGIDDNQYVLFPQRQYFHTIKSNEKHYCQPHKDFKPRILKRRTNKNQCGCNEFEQPTHIYEPNLYRNNLQRRYSLPVPKITKQTTPPDDNILIYVLPTFRSTLIVDAHVSSCISNELVHSKKFRKRFLQYIRKNGGFRSCISEYEEWTEEEQDMWENYLKVPYLVDVVTLWPFQKIDYSWLYRVTSLLHQHIHLEEGFAWLSTLGGAHSALGELFLQHAEKAGRISKEQLKLSLLLGNSLMIAKCYVFWAWSLIQKDDLPGAKRCIRNVWQWCQAQYCRDSILTNMCLAVWSRLQWKLSLRRAARSLRPPSCNPGRNPDHHNNNRDVIRKNKLLKQDSIGCHESLNQSHGDSQQFNNNVRTKETVNVNSNDNSHLVSLNSSTGGLPETVVS